MVLDCTEGSEKVGVEGALGRHVGLGMGMLYVWGELMSL